MCPDLHVNRYGEGSGIKVDRACRSILLTDTSPAGKARVVERELDRPLDLLRERVVDHRQAALLAERD